MTPFSRKGQLDKALEIHKRRAHCQCIAGENANPDFRNAHASAWQEYQTHKKFTIIDKDIKDKHNKHVKQLSDRRQKLGRTRFD